MFADCATMRFDLTITAPTPDDGIEIAFGSSECLRSTKAIRRKWRSASVFDCPNGSTERAAEGGKGMILTDEQITRLGMVHNTRKRALKPTSYNATVGKILCEGREITADHFDLPPRGIVWVVSNEEFQLPQNVTGLATLKTTWTHDGILALNVGIVDPGWHGPLAAAIVNFSKNTFTVRDGGEFLRVVFHQHDMSEGRYTRVKMDDYLSKVRDKSAKTSGTFLDMTALSRELMDEVFTLPRWLAAATKYGVAFAVIAVLVALLAIFVPIAWDISEDWFARENQIERLQRDVRELQRRPFQEAPRVPASPAEPTRTKAE
jgi:deoxycytidine triphosphate deaminase